MNSSSFYTQVQDDTSILRNGGLILKGKTRLERQPVHMMLAVDTSGSMAHEGKLSSVKKSIHLLLSLLSPEDRLSLVTFSDESKTFLNRVIPTNEERQAIQYRINNLTPEGSTNMSAGLLELRGLVEPPSSGRKQGLVLLTDGHANMGVHTEQGLVEILQRIQSESPGLSLTTVAYGVEHNAEMLTNLAKVGGGAYNVVTNLEDVASVFGDILGSLMSVSAQKVEVQLPPGAEAFTSFRTQKDAAGVTTVYVGDLYADVEVTILFKSSPNKGPLRIKATDMSTLDLIDIVLEPTLLTDLQAVPVALTMAEYRQKTIALLAAIRSNSSGSRSATQDEIEALLTEIQTDQRIREHPLKDVLLEDLQQALQMSRRGALTQQETIEVTQHSAYLGMSRGLRSTTSHMPPLRRQVAVNTLRSFSGDPISPPASPPLAPQNITSPFANRMQTQMASVMRVMSSQPEENSQSQ